MGNLQRISRCSGSMFLPILNIPFLLIFIPQTKASCWFHNPWWKGAPVVEQVSLLSVRVSWSGLLGNARCADKVRVKYWKMNSPNEWKISDKLPVAAEQFVVQNIDKYIKYAFQVIAIEEKAIRSTDYNKSPATSFKTSREKESVSVDSPLPKIWSSSSSSDTEEPLQPRALPVDQKSQEKEVGRSKSSFETFFDQHRVLFIIASVVGGIIVLVLVVSAIVASRLKMKKDDITPLTESSYATRHESNDGGRSPELSRGEKQALSLILRANK